MASVNKTSTFQFKQFSIHQDRCAMKVGTDGVLLGAWAAVEQTNHILDIGTGTGVIAIMLAQRVPNALIDAVEIDEASWQQATENMQQSPWSTRLKAHHIAIQDFAKWTPTQYDLIVSNPPFFTGGTFSSNQSRLSVRHTIKLPSGDLLNATRTLLSDKGKFCVILPYIEGLRFVEMAERYHLSCTKMTMVKPKVSKRIERLLLQFERQQNSIQKNTLVIQKEGRNNYTAAYLALTKNFYAYM